MPTQRAVSSALLVLLAAAAEAFAGEPPGLVSRFRAEGDTTDALGANNGTAVGNVAYAPGADGMAFSLDGASYVDVASPTVGSSAGAFTVAAWITMPQYSATAPVVNYRSPANAEGFSLEQRFANDGSMLFAVNQTGIAEDFRLVSAPGWKTGTLYHVAATFDSVAGSMVLYRDGLAVAWKHDLPRRRMQTAATSMFQIGHNIVAGSFWRGLIDDVRLYGRALSPAEVAFLARPASPVSHWRFDEQPGATVARDSVGAFDGTLAGGAAFVPGGIAGNCVTLDRATSSLVNMGTAFPAFTSGDFSVVAWIKASAIAADSLAVAKHEAFVSNGYLFAVAATGGGGQAGRTTFYASDPQVAQSPVSATPIDDGQWHQIVGVYRAGGMHSVYVDGAPAEASTASSPVTDRGAPFLVGGVNENGTPVPRYTGLVDDVQVYASALTDPQIAYLFSHPGRGAPGAQFDLARDWSDDANPNGAWIYREGTNALPHIASWAGPDFQAAQPAWARSSAGSGNTFLPAWFRSIDGKDASYDWLGGDVVVHTTDPANGAGNGVANVVWTSPFRGVVDVSGAVWMGRDIGRANDWALYRNATLLAQGSVASGDAYDREHPFDFATVAGTALTDVAVAPDDTLRLEVAKTSGFGDFAGVQFAVNVPATPRVVSYLLPKKVTLKLKGAGKDSLAVTGTFDDGGLVADLAAPVTVEIAGFTRTVTLTQKGAAWSFKDANFALTVVPRLKQSSRGTFTVKVSKSTLADVIDPNAQVLLRLTAAGLPGMEARVLLSQGKFALGKAHGSLVAPAFFPSKAKATANDVKADSLSFTAGFSHPEAPPASIGRVRVSLGRTFDRVIDGAAFTMKNGRFTRTESVGGGSITVSIDFAKELVTVTSKGIEVGELADETTEVVFDDGTGAGPVTARVRLGSAGTKRSY